MMKNQPHRLFFFFHISSVLRIFFSLKMIQVNTKAGSEILEDYFFVPVSTSYVK